jgi:hypothetical protein
MIAFQDAISIWFDVQKQSNEKVKLFVILVCFFDMVRILLRYGIMTILFCANKSAHIRIINYERLFYN